MAIRENWEQGANKAGVKLWGERERETDFSWNQWKWWIEQNSPKPSTGEVTGFSQAKGAGPCSQVLNTKGEHDRVVSQKKLLVHCLIVLLYFEQLAAVVVLQ